MSSTSLLVFLFAIVPGFIADGALRALFGHRQLSDFERTVRSLSFSVVGLMIYLVSMQCLNWLIALLPGYAGLQAWLLHPPYLQALGTSQTRTLTVSGTSFVPFFLHSAVTVSTALGWGFLLSRPSTDRVISARTGRSMRGTAWQVFWSKLYWVETRVHDPSSAGETGVMTSSPGPEAAHHRWLVRFRAIKRFRALPPLPQERLVTVYCEDGSRIMGNLQAASDESEQKDVVLGHPWRWDEERQDWHAEGFRFVYIPAEQVVAIGLSAGGDEIVHRGYLQDLQQGEHHEPGILATDHDHVLGRKR